MEQKPLLAFVTLNSVVNDYLCRSVKSIIGHLIDVGGYAQDRKNFLDRSPDLVITSGPYCDSLAARIFPGVHRITAFRVLTGEKLEQVLEIPTGTRVLVISNLREIAQESVDALQQGGVNHIIYDCWWSGMEIDPSQYDYALAPGVQHLCPYTFKHLINLGLKSLSVRTFVEILSFFHLDLGYADIYENTHLKTHVDTCSKIIRTLGESEESRRNQSFILNELGEGIISMDDSRSHLFCNQSARKMFGVSEDQDILSSPAFKRISSMFDKQPLKENSNLQNPLAHTSDVLVNILGRDMLCRKSMIHLDGKRQYLYMFRAAEQIRKWGESLQQKQRSLNPTVRYTFDDIWGNNPYSLRLKERAKIFAATEQTVLIVGESGTGKEMLAQSIHHASPRSNGPFVGINLASMSQSLIESELFGYSEGAFTGAQKGGKAGLFETAHGGTIFLDEIGDAPLSIQVLLLRVLEERVITRVGSCRPVPINVRIVAATNRPLQEMIKTGQFRSDLYYRLNVLSLCTLPLREMRDEIKDFLTEYLCRLCNRPIAFSTDAIRMLEDYSWPGNFRELKNLVEYLHYTCENKSQINPDDLPEYLLQEMGAPTLSQTQSMVELEHLCLETSPLRDILKVLYEASPRGIGRGTILSTLDLSGIHVSEGKLKHYMEQLKDQGLIYSGTTKQGSFLTAKGIDFFKACCLQ
ncbi:sigma-54 interaction domain-containing protein [Intestinimonas sp. HCP28S3_D6]|uniref:sigma-54 interaction domain-containing protein n=1 Tax=Intestinimonas sp. HCP28S3_D6 TaxID=3438942 RepID=UPI003F89724F